LEIAKKFIYIPFLEYWENKMLKGEKTCTSRVRRYGVVGDYFKVFNVEFEITDIKEVRLEEVRDKYYIQEGCDSKEKFEKIWSNIHTKKGFVPEQMVWLHIFKKIK
jgi:hypothetical protein